MRRDRQIPAYKSMELYFDSDSNRGGFKGKRRTTLPIKLQEDLQKTQTVTTAQMDHNNKTITFNNRSDLENMKKIAQERDDWKTLTYRIRRADEAEPSDDGAAERR